MGWEGYKDRKRMAWEGCKERKRMGQERYAGKRIRGASAGQLLCAYGGGAQLSDYDTGG